MILLEDLLSATAPDGAELIGPARAREFEGFAFDSRNVRGGELFLAIRTDRADGHDFIADAVNRGAVGVLCERRPTAIVDPDPLSRATVVQVPDTRAALSSWAAYVLRRQAPTVIAVTGSVGKTLTTKAIAGVLRRLGHGGAPADPRAIFENDNFNHTLGLPIALAGLEPAHRVGVLELASDSAGEIDSLCALTSPRHGLITNVARAHLESFDTPERLAEELGALAQHVTGTLVLNRDDPLLAPLAKRTTARIVWFGTSDHADVRASDVSLGETGVHFTLRWGDTAKPVRVPLLGIPGLYASLGAAAIALADGRPLEDVVGALEALTPVAGRLRPLTLRHGGQMIDDSFSSSPPSLLAAVATLAAQPRPRALVLGHPGGALDADELTSLQEELSRDVDAVIAVGEEAESLVAGAAGTRVEVTHTIDDAVARVEALLESPHSRAATVLVKGSETARLERVVERLMAEPSHAAELLVRQAPGAKQVVPLQVDRAAWMEVDLGAIAANLTRLREIAAPAGVMAVLKADAYGHGALRVARTAVQYGADMLGVAVLSEALALRERGIGAPVLVLGYTPAWQARDVVRGGVAVSLFSLDVARALSDASIALARPPVAVHVKVDTGMHRLGLAPEQTVPFARAVSALPGVHVEGVFTHFASADEANATYTHLQLARFIRMLEEWHAAGVPRPRYVHAANSAATLRYPESRFDLVRTGIALYGMDPSAEARCPSGFRPALALKTQLAQVKAIDPGEPVSYGRTWTAERPTRLGVLPIGYADGFRRGPANWGEVLIRGRRVPLVGRVCMDMCMVDVTDVPEARTGDEVVLIGEQQGERITAEQVAARLGTINYEVVSQILARVPREIVSR